MIAAAAPAAIVRPDLGRAGEGDLGHIGVLDQALPAGAPGADDDVDDALRQARRQRELGEAQRGQRRQLGRLQHDRVAGRERRPELPGGDRQGEVPGRDQPHHAERLAHGEGLAAGHRDRVAEQPLGRAGVVAEGVHHHRHLAARVGDRLAGVARLEHGQLLVVLGERVGERMQGARARRGGERAPGR